MVKGAQVTFTKLPPQQQPNRITDIFVCVRGSAERDGYAVPGEAAAWGTLEFTGVSQLWPARLIAERKFLSAANGDARLLFQ